MSLVRRWFTSRSDARWAALFDSNDRLEVATFDHGHSDHRTLKRTARFDEAMIELVEAGLKRPDFRGILYVMARGTREQMSPLYIGKAGRFGRDASPRVAISRTSGAT